MSERITGELRRKMDTLGWYDEDGNIVYTTGGTPAGDVACLVINSETFGELCDAIDAVHNGLERENDRLKCELDRVLGELDDMQNTDGISVNSGGFMHEASITDELREWFKDRMFMANGWQEIRDIADRIDAEHESACAEAYGNGVMSVPIALDESAWVKLPVDADGEPIHIGDVMEWVRYKDDDQTIVRTVSGIGNGVFFAWSDEQGRYAQYEAHAYRHHTPDTWERIIKDALTMPIHGKADVTQFVARCKALAGDAE